MKNAREMVLQYTCSASTAKARGGAKASAQQRRRCLQHPARCGGYISTHLERGFFLKDCADSTTRWNRRKRKNSLSLIFHRAHRHLHWCWRLRKASVCYLFTNSKPRSAPRGSIRMRFTSACLLSVSLVASAIEPAAAPPLRGYTPEHSTAEVQWEQKFRALPDAARLRENMRRLAARPHHVAHLTTRTMPSGCWRSSNPSALTQRSKSLKRSFQPPSHAIWSCLPGKVHRAA